MSCFDDLPPAPSRRARDDAHHAVQLVAAAGFTLLQPDPAFHASSTTFDADTDSLVGAALPDGRRARLGLRDLVLTVGGARLSLLGTMPEAAVAWLSEALGQPIRFPEWEMPDGATVERPAWAAPPDELGRLAHWYAASYQAFLRFEPGVGKRSELRVWPHHFDLATLVTISASEDPEHATSVGIGMTPGDAAISEPYLYVTPWPYPDPRPTPTLPAGRWNVEGWYGAVLPSGHIRSDAQVDAFLRAAFDHALAVLP